MPLTDSTDSANGGASLSPEHRRGLTSYQQEWTRLPRYGRSADGTVKARTKTFTKARRIGGSMASAVDACNLAAGYEWDGRGWANARPIDVHVVSASFNQSKNVLAEAAEFLGRVSHLDERYKANVKATTIEFEHGAAIIAHPARPASLRTYTGALFVDEFAFIQNAEDVWAAAKNIAAATLKEPRGYPVSLVTTPWAAGGFAHRIFTSEELPFQRLSVDIYKAKLAGFPIDIEQTRQECALDEIFATEYECQWLKGGACFFDPELLVNCERDDLPEVLAREPSYFGIDIGRTNDLTCIVEMKLLGDVAWFVGIQALRGVHFDDQRDTITSTLASGKFRKVLIDRGGMGMDLADHLERKYASRAKGVNFNLPIKAEMAVGMKAALEGGRIRFWNGATAEQAQQMRALRVELASIRAKPAAGGVLTFDTPRTVTGHGDRAWAAMLALRASAGLTSADGEQQIRGRLLTQMVDQIPIG